MILCALVAFAGVSCDPALIGEVTSESTGTNRNAKDEDGDEENDSNKNITPIDSVTFTTDPTEILTPKTLYVTGVEYPEGVDWQRDIGYDIEGSILFLMKNGERIVELPVGYDECVAIDADMHRCIDGHLYTDFSTDDETVVKVDGKEAYRYAGREMIVSMYVKDDKIYTLSAPRAGGKSWNYRCNGERLLSQSGEIIGGLYEDDGDIVFSSKSGSSGSYTYYMFVNGISYTLYFDSSDKEVFDVRRIGNDINYISSTNSGIVAMGSDSVVVNFGTNPSNYEVNLGIYYDGKDRFYAGSIGVAGGVWQEGENSMQCEGSVVGFNLRDNSYICVIKNTSNEAVSICCDGKAYPWPTGTELLYDTCVATDGISYTVGLIEDTGGNPPVIWEDGALKSCNVNGFITHVDYW